MRWLKIKRKAGVIPFPDEQKSSPSAPTRNINVENQTAAVNAWHRLIDYFIPSLRYLGKQRRHGELTTVRVVAAATRRRAQRKATPGKNNSANERRKSGSKKKHCCLTFSEWSGLPLSKIRSSHELMAWRSRCVCGRRSCRFLLHLSVPEGLQTLCTEFGGVAQNAKWTLRPKPWSERPHDIP